METYTIKDVIGLVINDLGRIAVPIELDDVSDQIRRARMNLIECVKAIERDEAAQTNPDGSSQEEPAQDDDIKIEMVHAIPDTGEPT